MTTSNTLADLYNNYNKTINKYEILKKEAVEESAKDVKSFLNEAIISFLFDYLLFILL